MSIDWFNTSQRRRSINDTSPVKPSFDTAGTSQQDDGETVGRPSLQRATTAPLTTPHDVALSLLTGVPKDIDNHDAPRTMERRSDAAVPLNRDTSTSGPTREDGSVQDPGSSTIPLLSSTLVENVYDPFTGNIAGVLYPRSMDHTTTSDPADGSTKKKDSLQFDQAKDDLWGHLARIRDLQSEIAGMHVRMEGIGVADGGRGGQKRPPGPGPRMHTDTISGAGDEWVDAEQEAKAREKARDAEFTKLAESFEGRRGAIDGIMDKLDDLSKALTTFHALPTPQIDALFRSNTKDSSTTSPVLRSPSPMFTNPASSPPPGSPPPMSPTSPPPDFGRRGARMSRNMGVVRTDFGFKGEVLSPMSESPVSDEGRL